MAQFDKYGRVKRSSLGSSSSSFDSDDIFECIGMIVYYIIAGLIFYFYAWDEYGLGWGIVYSLFWPISVPLMWYLNR